MRKRWFIFLTIVLSACGPRFEFQGMKPVPVYGWVKDSTFAFELEMSAGSGPFDMNVEIRHAGNYPYSNLFVFLRSDFPDGGYRIDTLDCLLAKPSGEWYGSGLGDLLSLTIPFRKNVQFNQEGTYSVSLGHGMRQDTLEGITDIGMSLYQSQQSLTSKAQ